MLAEWMLVVDARDFGLRLLVDPDVFDRGLGP